MNEKEEGWIFPLAAPYFPQPPYHMTPESQYIMVFYEADIEKMKNAFYPHLDKLHPKKYLYACYVRPNTILPYGKVIWEEFH